MKLVMPAHAGIQFVCPKFESRLDPGFRWNDG
jgi:hypothetical protein